MSLGEGDLGDWPELQRVIDEKRCEVVIPNQPLNKRKPSIDDPALQLAIFQRASAVNFIDLSGAGVSVLRPSIGFAQQLTNLVLHSNSIRAVPNEIGTLKKLKLLDFSRNLIESLPDCIGTLPHLMSLNVSHNLISRLPDLGGLVCLQLLDVSYNALTEFPISLPKDSAKIQTILLNSNRISSVPDDVGSLGEQLKTINLATNSLAELPLGLSRLPKLKTLDLTENKFTDKRFGKLAADKRHTASAVVEYLRRKMPSSPKGHKDSEGDVEVTHSESNNTPHITVHFGSNAVSMKRDESVIAIRPHVVCCVLRNLEIDHEKLKLLLAIQNRLHDTMCGQRTLASIGTHDLSKLRAPLTYLALEPDSFKITPLHKTSEVSGRELVTSLLAEAEQIRKKQKRHTFSSIHKYLHLVEKLPSYPCIRDADGLVISFEPVTNCEATKVSVGTCELLVEVTSGKSQDLCRQIADTLVDEIAKNKFSSNLVVEQIKVLQHTNELLVAYPGKLDLQSSSVPVKRELQKGAEAFGDTNSDSVAVS